MINQTCVCDSCGKQIESYYDLNINMKERKLGPMPKYHGYLHYNDGVAFSPSTQYELCKDCVDKVLSMFRPN